MATVDYLEYRMCKTVVQALANGDSKKDILVLCRAWGIEPYTSGAEKGGFLYWETIQKLAQYVIDYTDKNKDSE